ncbi:putative serine/threonine-protein kinase Nek2-like [Capsicum annuum]|nr:putative serine/threonine-protein kinase Nek2-like [Capsicum annuum]
MDLSFGSKYLTTAIKTGIVTGVIALAWPFSRTAVNFNAGCKTAVSNIVMTLAVMVTLMLLTPLFHFIPLVVLSSIIIAAMLGLIDYNAAIHLWHVDKFDFLVCMSAYIGVVFGNIEIGLVMAGVTFCSKAKDFSTWISRWIDDEEDNLKSSGETTLQYVILDTGAVGNIDTSGISMFEEVKKNLDRRDLKLVLANPGAEVMKKLNKSKFTETLGQEWMFLTVGEAVEACSYMLHSCKPKTSEDGESQKWSNHVTTKGEKKSPPSCGSDELKLLKPEDEW